MTAYNVGDASPAYYVRAGRQNIVTVVTADNPATFKVQVSPDGVAWYDLLGAVFAVTTTAPAAFGLPPGLFHFRLKCTVAGSGAATVTISANGGY